MDAPEVLWKRYLDLEIELEEFDRARAIYERLLEAAQHIRVYKTYTEFEANTTGDMEKARKVYERGVGAFKDAQQNEQRAMLFEYWLKTEKQNWRNVSEQLEQAKSGEIDEEVEGVELLVEDAEEWVEKVKKRQPQKVKKQRRLADIDGQPDYEEYIDYVFPDDEENKKPLKILAAAAAWKAKKKAEEEAAKAAAGQ